MKCMRDRQIKLSLGRWVCSSGKEACCGYRLGAEIGPPIMEGQACGVDWPTVRLVGDEHKTPVTWVSA